jgi:hypothetical protein
VHLWTSPFNTRPTMVAGVTHASGNYLYITTVLVQRRAAVLCKVSTGLPEGASFCRAALSLGHLAGEIQLVPNLRHSTPGTFLAPTWHNHTVLDYHTTRISLPLLFNRKDRILESPVDRLKAFCEGSWESALAGAAVIPHPHKSCLMVPRSLSCNHDAGNRPQLPRCQVGRGRLRQGTRR